MTRYKSSRACRSVKNSIILVSSIAHLAAGGELSADQSTIESLTGKCIKYVNQVPNCKYRYIVHYENNVYREFSKFDDRFYIKEFANEKYDQLVQSVSFDGKHYYHLTTQLDEKYLVIGSNVSIAAWAFRSYFVSNPLYEPFSFFVPNYEGFSLPLIAFPDGWLRASSNGMMPVNIILNQAGQRGDLVYKYRKDDANDYLIKFRLNEETPYSVAGKYRDTSFTWATNGVELKQLRNGKQFKIPKFSEYVARNAQNSIIPNMTRTIKLDSGSFEEIPADPGLSVYQVGIDIANEIYDADLGALIKTREN
ncbi:MAG: hypothetical protein ABI600_14925 [Luteolibacter sp.]